MESANFQFILYGDKSTRQQFTVNDPPAYRSTYVSGAQVNDAGHLILSFSDGSTVDSGYVVGGTGAQGPQGPQGISVQWCSAWNSTIEYSYLNCVTSDGDVYIYIASDPTIGVPVTNTVYWELMLRRGASGADGADGVDGADGITFTPLVSADGVLSWTNNGNATNPASVNLKGEPGNGFKILGYYSTLSALMSSVVSPSTGDTYGVGASEPYDIYIFDGIKKSWVNNGQLQGAKGDSGTTFTPSVSSDGTLSWTNNDGKENPPSVNIKGATGADGAPGKTPVKGTDYFTEADKQEVAAEAAALVNIPVASVNGKTGAVALGKSDVALGNVDNVKQYSASNPPPYPVTSVNGKTGAVTVRELPSVAAADNGKFLRVVSGAWAAAEIADANGGSF